jgi:hypothetical protein
MRSFALILAFVVGAVLFQTTPMPGPALAKQTAKGEPKSETEKQSLPVLAAGFVNAQGKLTRAAGANLTVRKEEADLGVLYHVTFVKELASTPVVVATSGGARNSFAQVYEVTRNGFTVACFSPTERVPYVANDFNFIVVKMSEGTP